MTKKATRPIRSDETLLSILEALEAATEPSIGELAESVDASKSTVHNHLSTLRQHGYVVKDGQSYRLGLRFLELGESVRTGTDIYDVARQHVDALSRETELLVNIAVEERGRGVYLYRTRVDDGVQLATRAGEAHELHCTATGKALLAHSPTERVESILRTHGLPELTENTITERDELLSELQQIRERGVAFDDEEYGRGLRCVGAPILDSDDAVVGAISASGPATELVDERFTSELPTRLEQTANRIELSLRNY